jgi:toxin HigB-1
VIESFRHKGLKELFERGRSGKVPSELQERCLRRLDALNAAQNLGDVKHYTLGALLKLR